MKIWMLQIGEILPLTPDARRLRTAILSEKLSQKGHSVLWWTSSFDHLQKQWICNEDQDFEINSNLTIKALKGVGYKNNISLMRLIDHRILAWKFRKLSAYASPPDIIVASMPSYDLAYEAVKFGHRYGVPVLVDIRDQWPDIFIDSVPQKLKSLARLVLHKEFTMMRTLCKEADGLLSMSDALLNWGLEYAERGKTWRDRVFYLGYRKDLKQNGALPPKIAHLSSRLNGRFVVTFIGTFATYHNPSLLIDCARKLASHDIVFVLAGRGELLLKLKQKAAGMQNVLFPGWLNQKHITALLRRSNVGVCPTGKAHNRVFFPNKAFAYLSEGLPLLSAFGGEIRNMIEKHGVGYTYDGVESLARLIVLLQEHKELYKRMSSNAQALFHNQFDAETIYKDYSKHIEDVANSLSINMVRRN